MSSVSNARRLIGLVLGLGLVCLAAQWYFSGHIEKEKVQKKRQAQGRMLFLQVEHQIVDLNKSSHEARMAWEQFKLAEYCLISQGAPTGFGDCLFHESLISAQDWIKKVPDNGNWQTVSAPALVRENRPQVLRTFQPESLKWATNLENLPAQATKFAENP